MQRSARHAATLLNDLRSVMQGPVMEPDDRAYHTARKIWNGAVDNRPALIATCHNGEDVQAAVLAARRHRVPLSVLGGGYDWAGRSMRHLGLVIDLSAMNDVRIDAQARSATVQGGATAANVVAAAGLCGLTAVTGAIGKIGMVGFTLAGGYGPLSPRFGLGVDNLISAEIVLADGRRLRANASENADLFWALRGGGGNFGVVTSMEIRLHPVRAVLAGKILFPWSDAHSVLSGYAKMMASAPDELALTAALISAPNGNPAIVLAPCWSGDLSQGLELISELQGLGSALTSGTGVMPPGKIFDMFEPSAPPGRCYVQQTRWLPDITHKTVGDLIAIGSRVSSPLSVVTLQSFHGMPARVPLLSTAFGLRQKHFLVSIVGAWNANEEENGDAHSRWARGVSEQLAASALPGGYPNLLGPDERLQSDAAYGVNKTRLLAMKHHFDPEDTFIATSLPLEGFAEARSLSR